MAGDERVEYIRLTDKTFSVIDSKNFEIEGLNKNIQQKDKEIKGLQEAVRDLKKELSEVRIQLAVKTNDLEQAKKKID